MAGKLSGSAIQSGTITVTQLSVGLNDTTNAAYAQANSAYGQANAARSDANTTFATVNTTFGTINTNYQAAYAQANTRLSASGGTLAGDLIITGNLTVSGNSTTLNTEILTVEDADIVLLSNVASTPALNAGIIVNRGTSTNTFLRWDEVTDKWGWSDDGSTTYKFNSALDAYAQANSAYGAANNTVLKAGDTMTGQLNISSGGLLVTGNVGIGTTSPGARLEVAGQDSSGTVIVSGDGGANGVRLNLKSTAANGRQWMLMSGGTSHGGAGVFNIRDGTAGNNYLTIDSSGNLGIGTTNPAAYGKFTVFGTGYIGHFNSTSGSVGLGFYENGTGRFYIKTLNGSDGLAFIDGDSTTEHMRIDASGNLGIGTSSISGKLSLNETDLPFMTLKRADTIKAYFGIGNGSSLSATAAAGDTILRAEQKLVLRAGGDTGGATIDSSGNVSIGVASANVKLTVIGTTAASASTSQDNGIFLVGSTNGVQLQFTSLQSPPYGIALQTKDNNNAGPYNYPLLLQPVNGSVGIGTTSPSNAQLVVKAASAYTANTYFATRLQAANYSDSGGYTTMLGFGVESAGWSKGAIGFTRTGSYDTGYLAFYLNNTADSSMVALANERARFLNNGNFCIGKTTASESATTGSGFGFASPANDPYFTIVNVQSGGTNGCIYLNRRNTQATNLLIAFYTNDGTTSSSIGSITHNNTATAYNTSSDRRLKDNIAPADNAGAVIDAIEVVKHDWKVGGHTRYGIIAQDLHSVAPEAVLVGDADDVEELKNPWGVDYSKLVPMLVKELQSVRARLAALESK